MVWRRGPDLNSRKAGVFAGSRATFFAGLVGSFAYSLLFPVFGLNATNALHRLSISNALIWFWGEGPALMLMGAVAGAAVQMLRSNFRWSGP